VCRDGRARLPMCADILFSGWGMLGVINPANNTPLDTQIELAKQANYMIEPGQPLPQQDFNSLSALAATATTTTLTVTATNSWEPTTTSATSTGPAAAAATTTGAASSSSSGTHLSAGAIAGIAIGAAAAAIIAAALFFMLGRNKSMKDELQRLRGPGQGGGDNGHMSQLPPYQQAPVMPYHEYKPAPSPHISESWSQNPRSSGILSEADRYR
jgi:hypothetical protein